jgi:hypothetical protein
LEITLSVGILEGLNFIRKIGNPWYNKCFG